MRKEHAYFLGGVNGVGKSTLLGALTEINPDFEVFKGSAMLMGRLGIDPGDYDSLRQLPDELKNKETGKMMEELLSRGSGDEKTLIIDAHYIYYKKGEMIDVTGEWMRLLDALFVVNAPAEVVLARLEQASSLKIRDLLPPNIPTREQRDFVSNCLELTLKKAKELSEKYDIPCFVIDNETEGIQNAVQQFLAYHETIRTQ